MIELSYCVLENFYGWPKYGGSFVNLLREAQILAKDDLEACLIEGP